MDWEEAAGQRDQELLQLQRGDARWCVSALWGLEGTAPVRERARGVLLGRGAGERMEGQAAPGAGGGGEEPLSSGRMNPKRSGRAAEEESRNKPKLVSELRGWRGGQGAAWR